MTQSKISSFTSRIAGSWLDQVYSRASLGVTFDQIFHFDHQIQSALSPVVERWSSSGRAVEIALSQGAVRIQADTTSLYVTNQDVTFQASDSPTLHAIPGRRAELRYRTDSPAAYSVQCGALLEGAEDVTEALIGRTGRRLRRVGIVAECSIDSDSAPPGVAALVTHLGKPWKNGLTACSATILATLASDEESTTQCHHKIDVNTTDLPGVITLRLDWQRVSKVSRTVRPNEVAPLLMDSAREALDYFESLGAGDFSGDMDDRAEGGK